MISQIQSKSIILFASIFIILSTQAFSQIPEIENIQSYTELESFIERHIVENDIPGVGAAIVSRDSILWIGCFGYADLESQKPVTKDTQFKIGSCTKTFTGLGLLKMSEEGLINLDMPLKEMAPEIEIDNPWHSTHPILIKHLVEHTAGFEDSRLNWFYLEKPIFSLKESIDKNKRLYKCRWQPGTRYSYSSPGYTLAGYVMEKILRYPYEEYIKSKILEPMGMKNATIGAERENKTLLAQGYGLGGKPIPVWYDDDEPSGAMNASVLEMARFIKCMLNHGSNESIQVLTDESFQKLGNATSTVAAHEGLIGGYNFGISTRSYNNQTWYAHGGLVPGFNVEYAYNPNCGLGYVVMVNRFGRFVYSDIIDKVEEYVFCTEEISPPKEVVLAEEEMDVFCGYYRPGSHRITLAAFMEKLTGGVTIAVIDGELHEKFYGGTWRKLIPVTENSFRRDGHPIATRIFCKSEDGTLTYSTTRKLYSKSDSGEPLFYIWMVYVAFMIVCTPFLYGFYWVPAHFIKLYKGNTKRSKYLPMRIMPLAAIGSLLIGILMMLDKSLLDLGTFSISNLVFTISTVLFAIFSIASCVSAVISLSKPVHLIAKIYAILVSLTMFGLTIYLGYWGFIGIRLWAY